MILTRGRDEFVSLRERVRIANQANADLFISLHCNATDAHNQRGFETWVASNHAIDIEDKNGT